MFQDLPARSSIFQTVRSRVILGHSFVRGGLAFRDGSFQVLSAEKRESGSVREEMGQFKP